MTAAGMGTTATGIPSPTRGWQKAAKTGLLATLPVLAKKPWWLVLLPLAWLGRRLFGKGENAA